MDPAPAIYVYHFADSIHLHQHRFDYPPVGVIV